MMAWSQINGRVLLYGGQSNVGPMLGDTWSWAGTDWVQHQPPNAPPPRLNAVMVEDPSGGVLLFGGYDGVAALGDHWLWNGANWTQLTPSPVPAPHFFAGAAYDPSVQRVLMVSASSAGTTDTWDWDGSVWTLREPARPASTNRQLRLAFDPQRGRVVMLDNLFYEWNGTTWQSLGAGPTAMYQPLALVTDTREGRALAVSSVTDPGVWRLARQPATVTAVGSGCALAPAGVPGLSLLGEPRFPQSGFAFELTGVLPSGLALLAIGSDRLDVPLGGGCTSHVRVPFTMLLAVADAQGVARTPMPIPDNPALRGAQVVAQGLSLDAVHSPFGVGTLTPALAIVVGD
jgi:hypothetical protein